MIKKGDDELKKVEFIGTVGQITSFPVTHLLVKF